MFEVQSLELGQKPDPFPDLLDPFSTLQTTGSDQIRIYSWIRMELHAAFYTMYILLLGILMGRFQW